MNLLSLLGLLGANGQDPEDPSREQTAESPLAPAQQKPQGAIDMGSPAANFMLGRAMSGDKTAAATIAPALRSAQLMQIKQQQQALMVRGYAAATAKANELLKARDFEGASQAFRDALPFAMNEGQQKVLQEQAAKYGKFAEQVRQGRAMRDAAFLGGPQAAPQGRALEVLENPELVDTLSMSEGGLPAAMKNLAPTYNFEGGVTRRVPSPLEGGEPRVVDRELPDIKLTPEEARLAGAKFGVTDQMLNDLNRDPATRHVAQGTLVAIRKSLDTRSALNTYVKDSKVHDILAARPDAEQLMAWASHGGPAEQQKLSQAIVEAQRQVEDQKVKDMVREAWERAAATTAANRAATANDIAKLPGGEVVYDLRTRHKVPITERELRNPALWRSTNNPEAPLVAVDKNDSRQLELQRGEMEPTIPTAMRLADRLLAKATGQNLPRGAELAALRRLGGPDIKLFDEQMRTLYIALSRIESGSVRIPVTMFQALQGTGPDNFSSVTQAKQFLNAVTAAMQNRENSYFGLPMVPIPSGTEPTVAITVKDGKLIKSITPKNEPDSGAPKRKLKLVD